MVFFSPVRFVSNVETSPFQRRKKEKKEESKRQISKRFIEESRTNCKWNLETLLRLIHSCFVSFLQMATLILRRSEVQLNQVTKIFLYEFSFHQTLD